MPDFLVLFVGLLATLLIGGLAALLVWTYTDRASGK